MVSGASTAGECAAADGRYRGGLPAERYDEAFPPRPGPGCGWCDYRGHCPEGMAAGESRRPWDGLASLSPAKPELAEPEFAAPQAAEPASAEPAPADPEAAPEPGGTAL